MGEDQGEIYGGVSAAPRATGLLKIPARDWRNGEKLSIQCVGIDGMVIDEFKLPIGVAMRRYPEAAGPTPAIAEDEVSITVTGEHFHVKFDKGTGLVTEGIYKNRLLIVGGPYLHIDHHCVPAKWTLASLTTEAAPNETIVVLAGSYGDIDASFRVRIDGNGLLTTEYTIDRFAMRTPAKGFNRIGVGYEVSETTDEWHWAADSLWSVYPQDHIGRPEGVARRRKQNTDAWSDDESESTAILKFGRPAPGATHDFRALKERIWFVSAVNSATGQRLRAESDGTDAAQLTSRGVLTIGGQDPEISYRGSWNQIDTLISWNLSNTRSNAAGDAAELTFSGSEIRFYGFKSNNCGMARVYVDGKFEAVIDLYHRDETPSFCLFEKTGLSLDRIRSAS